jgi:7-cyano-7-deazaguanine synthase
MAERRVVVLMSGGLDSSVLASVLEASGYEVNGLSIDYGQRHRRELECAVAYCRAGAIPHKVVTLEGFASLIPTSSQTNREVAVPHGHYAHDSMKSTVVPNRNMVMLSIAAAHAIAIKADAIAIAAHAGDHTIYPDCRREFLNAFVDAVREGNWDAEEFSLFAPFVDVDKAGIVTMGQEVNAPMHLTYSCYEGRARHCGRCGTCVERREAFQQAGITDPTEYEA